MEKIKQINVVHYHTESVDKCDMKKEIDCIIDTVNDLVRGHNSVVDWINDFEEKFPKVTPVVDCENCDKVKELQLQNGRLLWKYEYLIGENKHLENECKELRAKNEILENTVRGWLISHKS